VPLASLTGTITSAVANHGVYAVLGLMALGAVLPTASELVMVYAGAVASGAIVDAHDSFAALAVAGIAGNLAGALIGWAIGAYGGRPFVEAHGRWLHVTPARLERAERWFDRFGTAAVPLGFLTPLARSFVAIPAGLARIQPVRFAALALLGIVPFCLALAAAGWALGSHWERLHHDLRYAEVAIAVLLVAGIALWVLKRRSSTLARRRAEDSSS
jgi:membrane protein DedA with SNARE-associated domain